MDSKYDICVDYNALCTIEDKLQKIGYDLSESTEKMLVALQYCQGFLAGNQFEKAKRTTLNCIEITGKTSNNIKNAMEYISKLKIVLDEYSKCGYSEEDYKYG